MGFPGISARTFRGVIERWISRIAVGTDFPGKRQILVFLKGVKNAGNLEGGYVWYGNVKAGGKKVGVRLFLPGGFLSAQGTFDEFREDWARFKRRVSIAFHPDKNPLCPQIATAMLQLLLDPDELIQKFQGNIDEARAFLRTWEGLKEPDPISEVELSSESESESEESDEPPRPSAEEEDWKSKYENLKREAERAQEDHKAEMAGMEERMKNLRETLEKVEDRFARKMRLAKEVRAKLIATEAELEGLTRVCEGLRTGKEELTAKVAELEGIIGSHRPIRPGFLGYEQWSTAERQVYAEIQAYLQENYGMKYFTFDRVRYNLEDLDPLAPPRLPSSYNKEQRKLFFRYVDNMLGILEGSVLQKFVRDLRARHEKVQGKQGFWSDGYFTEDKRYAPYYPWWHPEYRE
jgi:hypothetical protein